MKILMAESLLSEPELRLWICHVTRLLYTLAGTSVGVTRSDAHWPRHARCAKKWHRGLVEAENLGDEAVTATLIEDPDLHDHLMKSLYET
jgi:hypothetical protein